MTFIAENIISPEKAQTLDGLFYERAAMTPDKVAYVQYDRKKQQWLKTSWNEMSHLIAHWQTAMRQENMDAGDRVAILLKNSKEWVIFDQAALGLGLVTVPLYLDDRPDNIAYILEEAAVKLLVVQEQRIWKKIKDNCQKIKSLQRIVLLDVIEASLELDDERLTTLSDWLPEQEHVLHKREANSGDLASIVYTSGTTGRPKGVMLSHANILAIAHGTAENIRVLDSDTLLSFLPLSHTFERTVGYYLPVMAGCTVTFSHSIQQLANELVLHKPTILISVPRIFEQIYSKIENGLKTVPIYKRLLFRLAIRIGWNRFLLEQGRKTFCLSCFFWPIFKKLVGNKVKDKFGGQIRIAATGGAAIPFDVAKTFLSLGINVLQGYGLTETSPVVSFNKMEDNDPRSIGQALNSVSVKLGEENELLIKGPGVMMGYWNNHAATAAVIDADGWFYSGDQAHIDPETQHIYITGRIKDILIMSNGEKIPPLDIENAIVLDEWFEQALLLGEGQAYLSAVLVFNAEYWTKLAKQNQLDPFDMGNLNNKKIHQQVINHLKQVLHDFPGYAKIRKVILSVEPWTVENEMLTPTLKVKRPVVIKAFEKEIEKIYS